MNFQSLPKVELHHHLDCGLSFEAARQLEPTLTRPVFEAEFVAPPRCRDLAEYLRYPPRIVSLLQTEAALDLAVADLFAQLKADHVIYAEIRFAPLLHCQAGLSSEAVVAAIQSATRRMIDETGIEARLILCTLRHFSVEQSLATARLVRQFSGGLVAALDLAGGEADFSIDAHVPAFEYAQQYGLNRIAHAGEALGPESVRETLDKLEPMRLGHGVRSIEDSGLVAYLARLQVHLEVCPSTNVQIGIFPSVAQHAVQALYQAGVSVGINTDTRTTTNISLTEEYEKLHEAFSWHVAEFGRCNRNALAASFAPDTVKASLSRVLKVAYD